MTQLVIRLARSPYLNLLCGLVLLGTGLYETILHWESGDVGVHHGVAFAGFVQALQSMPNLLAGAQFVDTAQQRLVDGGAVRRPHEGPSAGET